MAEELSQYEKERLAQIARNEAKLSELGLLSARQRHPAQARPPPPKRPRQHPAAKPPSQPVRRSERQTRAANAAEQTRSGPGEEAARAPAASSPPARERGTPSGAGLGPAERLEREPVPVGSSRSEVADLEALARLGVGNEVPGPATKASVMELASRGRCPKFSKYSGSIEWSNAIFLFVNVGGSDFSNNFSDSGRQMSWFAGSRQDKTTPLIRRLLGKSAPPRLLFCRRQGQGGASPYVYCGRVEYVQHYPDSHPLEVEWALADSAALGRSELFQELLAEAPVMASGK